MERMILHEGVYFDRFHCFRVYRNLLFHLADLSVQKSFYRIHYRLFSRRCMLRCVQICLLHRGGNCLGSAVCRCVWYRGIYSRHLSETPECKCLKSDDVQMKGGDSHVLITESLNEETER